MSASPLARRTRKPGGLVVLGVREAASPPRSVTAYARSPSPSPPSRLGRCGRDWKTEAKQAVPGDDRVLSRPQTSVVAQANPTVRHSLPTIQSVGRTQLLAGDLLHHRRVLIERIRVLRRRLVANITGSGFAEPPRRAFEPCMVGTAPEGRMNTV